MHNLAKQRLAAIPHTSVDFIIADFKQLDWHTVLNGQSLSNANFRNIQIGLEIEGLCTLQATLSSHN